MRTLLCWAGHVSMMEDHCLLKIVLHGELATGCHKRRAPKRRYKDSLKEYLSLGHFDCHQWSTLAPIGIHEDTPFMTLLLHLRMQAESVLRKTVTQKEPFLANIAKGDVPLCLL
ncbi:hypothetical protein WISP_00211 [Willisornis vidua]|uniref:Uncharacterized protein n=1 Tax=Willisornis vidua TaxID=1566151 RepID=A0ABQ9CJT7_9PASS|nr:hypothetical protein WISP_00211 [Willisornis vidua]